MKKCSNCGREFTGNFCPECGFAAENELWEFCTNCGTENWNGEKFCENCGASLEKKEHNSVSPEKKGMKNGFAYVCNISLFLAIIAIFLWAPIVHVTKTTEQKVYKEYYKYDLDEIEALFELTIQDVTELMVDDCKAYLEYAEDYSTDRIDDEVKKVYAEFMLSLAAVIIVGVIVVFTACYYLYTLVKTEKDSMQIKGAGQGFCFAAIAMIVVCFILLFVINAAMKCNGKEVVYTITPYVIIALVLAIIKMQIAVKKFFT